MAEISDADLREQLAEHGINVGPISDTTRSLYINKLKKLSASGAAKTGRTTSTKSVGSKSPSRASAKDKSATSSTSTTKSSSPARTRGRPPKAATTPTRNRGRNTTSNTFESDSEEPADVSINRSTDGRIIPGLANMPSRRSPRAGAISPPSPKKSHDPRARYADVSRSSQHLFDYSDNDDFDDDMDTSEQPEMVNVSINTSFVSPTTEAKRTGLFSGLLNTISGTSPTTNNASATSSYTSSYETSSSRYTRPIEPVVPSTTDRFKTRDSTRTTLRSSPYARAPLRSDSSQFSSTSSATSQNPFIFSGSSAYRSGAGAGNNVGAPSGTGVMGQPSQRFAQTTDKMGYCGQVVETLQRWQQAVLGPLFGWHPKEPVTQQRSSRYGRSSRYPSASSSYPEPPKRAGRDVSSTLLTAFLVVLAFLFGVYVFIAFKPSLTAVYGVTKAAVVDTGSFIYAKMILPIVLIVSVLAVIFGVYTYQKHVTDRRARRRQQRFDMVEKITDILRSHLNTAAGRRDPYLPIPHVRDMLIKPSQRTPEQLSLWLEAEAYINDSESRVITESKYVSGQESLVWRWLPLHEADEDDDRPGHKDNNTEHTWMGSALPEEQMDINSPSKPVTECLKIRGLFDQNTKKASDWVSALQDALLEKIGSDLRVKHLAVDTQSAQGCVYAYLFTAEEAFSAYKRLHGFWFDCRLVTVKFLRVRRYLERFPDAANAAYPLQVKKPRHSLWSQGPGGKKSD